MKMMFGMYFIDGLFLAFFNGVGIKTRFLALSGCFELRPVVPNLY